MLYALTAEQERRLGHIIQGGGLVAAREARNELILGSQALVRYVLYRLIRLANISEHDDCISEGQLALIRAAEKWDPRAGCRFASYAKVAIKHKMVSYLRRHRRQRCEVLADELADNAPPPSAVMATREEADRAFALVQELPPVLKFVILQRLGLVDGVAKTFGELAAEMHLPIKQTQDLYFTAMARFKLPA